MARLKPTVARDLCSALAPGGQCYGCGAAHPSGLRIQPYAIRDWKAAGPWTALQATWPAPNTPAAADVQRYCGHPGVLYGGTIASLFDCLGNWTASVNLALRERSLAAAGKREPGAAQEHRGTPLDAAALHSGVVQQLAGREVLSSVTGSLNVTYLKPTLLTEPVRLQLRARVVSEAREGRHWKIEGELLASESEATATFEGLFVRPRMAPKL